MTPYPSRASRPPDVASRAPNRLVIFDCDGVLVDSEPLTMAVLADLLAQEGIQMSPASLLARFRGRRIAGCLAELSQEHGLTLPPDFEARLRREAIALYRERLVAIPFVIEVLAHLDEPHCVASSAPREKIELMLALTGLSAAFGRTVFSAYELGLWKPDPGLFSAAAKAFRVRPENCAVVEDSDVGVLAGQAAGMATLRFDPEGLPSREDDEPRPGAVSTFVDMRELPGRLARWRAGLAGLAGEERHPAFQPNRQTGDFPCQRR